MPGMRLSVNGWSFEHKFKNEGWTNERWLEEMAELPIDAVEVNGRYLTDHAPANLKRFRRRATRLNVPLASFTVFNDFGKPSEELDAELEKVRGHLAACRWLGTPRMRIFAGWPVEDREAQWDTMIEYLRRSAEIAEEHEVLLMLENHNHGGFVQTGDDTLRVLKEVDHDHLGTILDPGNFIDGMRSVELVAPHASWLHVKVWELSDQGGDVEIDYPAILDIMKDAGFNGYCSLEYEPEDRSTELEDIRRQVTYFRSLIDERNAR